MGLGWKSACKEGKYTLQGLASTITLRGQIDGIYAALASGTQSIASTKTQINCKTCRLQKESLVPSHTSFSLHRNIPSPSLSPDGRLHPSMSRSVPVKHRSSGSCLHS